MCGIVGYVGTSQACPFLVAGLRRLEYRGYDSAGLAIVQDDGIEVVRSEGKLRNLSDKIETVALTGVVGIGHTRWATHGGKTDANAHPHTDSSGRIALVHNGTLNNANELRRELQSRGHVFNSETDTEVIVRLIGEYYEKVGDVKEATSQALARCDLQGSWQLPGFGIQREVGGNLAEVLNTTAATLRERDRLRRQIDVLSAEGRFSAWILGGLPIVFAVYLILTRPDYLEPLYTTLLGWALIVLAAILMTVGVFWLRKSVKVEV